MRRAAKERGNHRARSPLLLATFAAAGALAAGVLLWQLSGDGDGSTGDPGPVHVHGLGVDPADGALFVATHSGLYRAAAGERKAERVGERYQDTMGFTVAGPNRFLGSGHPDLEEARTKGLPPLLGLIESTDAGETWEPVSLLGEADFHLLRVAGNRVFGYDASNDRLLVSADGGRRWNEVRRPAPLVDLAVDPLDGRRLLVATERGVFASRDGGQRWTRVSETVGLLAWPRRDRLYLAAGDGRVLASADGGRRLRARGEIGGRPAALLAGPAGDLYVALHDGTIKRSTDGGSTWAVRSTP